MRRNVKSLVKFTFLSLATISLTILFFKLLRNIENSSFQPFQPLIAEDSKNFQRSIDFSINKENNVKIDWHDYKYIKYDLQRIGTGEQGKATHFTAEDDQDHYDQLFKENGFNAALSDKISVNRSLPDIRHKGCKTKLYLKHLPSVSVIVPFHNEHWSTLLRTVHSVINRSPKEILQEIILVDDSSTKEFTKTKLDTYITNHFSNNRVKIIRLKSRQGLIRARLEGAKIAQGDVLLFLDSHTEANVNWLPPLLEPIALNDRTCVCPFIDVIAWDTFEYRAQDEGARGAFDWEFFYKRLPLLPNDLKNPTEPFKSPVMAGGLFAISRRFFWELGGYDEGLDIWGGEQYELSFKIWQCGGQMFDAPCSRVGHIYRKFAPFPNPRKGDFVGKNYRRVAEVWMDEYAQYLYQRRPHYLQISPGDLTAQKALRQRLNCKSFKWFLTEIAFDLPKKYPPVEPPPFASGQIANKLLNGFCLSVQSDDDPIVLKKCDTGRPQQNFTLTWHKDIRVKGRTKCWDVADPNDKASVTLFSCHGMGGNQYWKYDTNKQWLIHGGNPRCLDVDISRQIVFVTKCKSQSPSQKWTFQNVNHDAMLNWDNIISK